jgi:nucleoid-associated protein YgaU
VIHRLHVGDIILIPPVEDLDPAYIDPPRIRTVPAAFESQAQNGVTELSAPPASSTGRDSVVTERISRTSTAAPSRVVAARRSRPTDASLDLPVSESVAGSGSGTRLSGLDRENDEKDDVGPAIRVSAGSHGSARSTGPVYKVRPYDTLRSIARDTLGDAHRASEILELNRGLIDDPNRLIVGQLIELPEDADMRHATTRKW